MDGCRTGTGDCGFSQKKRASMEAEYSPFPQPCVYMDGTLSTHESLTNREKSSETYIVFAKKVMQMEGQEMPATLKELLSDLDQQGIHDARDIQVFGNPFASRCGKRTGSSPAALS